MAEYDELDDATLQKMLSDASSYEERATIRQVMRKRKKEKGETTSHSKPRGTSMYNRFAGSTATKSRTGVGVVPSVAASNKPKQETLTSPARKPSPVQKPSTPPIAVQPGATPTPPPTPESAKSPDEVDGIPVTVEPAEDKEPESDEEAQQVTRDEPDLGIEEEAEPEEPQPEEPEPEEPTEPETKSPEPTQPEHAEPDGPSRPPRSTFEPIQDRLPASTNLHKYLVAYVNQELFLDPPLPNRGKALFDACSDPTSLCKLINKCVPGTVDMRALSKITGSSSQRGEALQDNMTLAVESGRAIGCQVEDETTEKILCKDPDTINKFLLDLIRARVVHMPGMDDEPSSTFADLDMLFQKLHISVDEPVSWRDDPDKVRKALKTTPPAAKEGSRRETDLTYEERAALRKAEREQRQKEKEAQDNPVGMTYDERAAQRKAERERRRKEREALAK